MDIKTLKTTCIKLYISDLSSSKPECIPHAMMMWNSFENGKFFPYVENSLALKDFALETEDNIHPMIIEKLIPLANMMHFINSETCDVQQVYLKYISNDKNMFNTQQCTSSKHRKTKTM